MALDTSIRIGKETLKLLNKAKSGYCYFEDKKFTIDETIRQLCNEKIKRLDTKK